MTVTARSPVSPASTLNQSWSLVESVRSVSVTSPTIPRSVNSGATPACPDTVITARKMESSSDGFAVSRTISVSPLARNGARL